MLNKKGQVGDAAEIFVAIIGILVGLYLISSLNAGYQFTIDNAKSQATFYGTDNQVYDASFIGTDLVNVLKYSFDEYTFGELLVYSASEQKDELSYQYFYRDIFGGQNCEGEVIDELHSYLSMYDKKWMIWLEDAQGNEIVRCPLYSKPFNSYGAEMQIPSVDGELLTVHMEVWQ
jgi:hypothetical protein